MTDVIDLYAPSMRRWREQQELEKSLIITTEILSDGPQPLDLDSGVVELRIPTKVDQGEVE